jgi:hypothetical protein
MTKNSGSKRRVQLHGVLRYECSVSRRAAEFADVIVTVNARDFPADILAPYQIEAQHPDEFIAHLLDLAPGVVMEAARRHRESLKNPAKTIEEYLLTIETQGLTQTASVLREDMIRSQSE